jgi:hypothetical protein
LNRAARDRVNHHCADKPATPRRIDPVAGAGFAQRGTLHALCAIDALGIGCPFQTDIAITCGRVVSSAKPDDTVVWYDLAYAEAAARFRQRSRQVAISEMGSPWHDSCWVREQGG